MQSKSDKQRIIALYENPNIKTKEILKRAQISSSQLMTIVKEFGVSRRQKAHKPSPATSAASIKTTTKARYAKDDDRDETSESVSYKRAKQLLTRFFAKQTEWTTQREILLKLPDLPRSFFFDLLMDLAGVSGSKKPVIEINGHCVGITKYRAYTGADEFARHYEPAREFVYSSRHLRAAQY